MARKQEEVVTSPIQVATMSLNIRGDTPLLMERFSDSTRTQLLERVTGKGKEKKKNRDMDAEVREKIHLTEDGKPGFPAAAFKRAMVEAAVYVNGMDKKRAKGSFFIMGNIIPIHAKRMVVNKVLGRDSGINRAPREIWRPEFQNWTTKLLIRFNASQITPSNIVELAKLAGFHIGVGGWRPQCSGSYGMFSAE